MEADDPLLTRRLGRNRTSPHWRIVLDGRLRVSVVRARPARAGRSWSSRRLPASPSRRPGASPPGGSKSGACRRAAPRRAWTFVRLLPALARAGCREPAGRGRRTRRTPSFSALGPGGPRRGFPRPAGPGRRPGAGRRGREGIRAAGDAAALGRSRAEWSRRGSPRDRPRPIDSASCSPGIVTGARAVAAVEKRRGGLRLSIAPPARFGRFAAGESVARLRRVPDGRRRGARLSPDLSSETLRRSTARPPRPGRVREPRASPALGRPAFPVTSSWATSTGPCGSHRSRARRQLVDVHLLDPGGALARFVVAKGSVALDGVSLTVAARRGAGVHGRRDSGNPPPHDASERRGEGDTDPLRGRRLRAIRARRRALAGSSRPAARLMTASEPGAAPMARAGEAPRRRTARGGPALPLRTGCRSREPRVSIPSSSRFLFRKPDAARSRRPFRDPQPWAAALSRVRRGPS